jgi:iron complex outermembrane receptor protein
MLLPEAQAQEVAPTAAGDVSAAEATPLPPIEVTSPSQPLSKKKKAAGGQAVSNSGGSGNAPEAKAAGDGSDGDGKPGIFTLGQLDMIGGSTVNNAAMWTFNTNTLEQAAALAGPARFSAYGKIDVDVMREQPPIAPILNANQRFFVSARLGCFTYQPVLAMPNLAALCLE